MNDAARTDEPWILYGLLIPPATGVLTLAFSMVTRPEGRSFLAELYQLAQPESGAGLFVFFGVQALVAALSVLYFTRRAARPMPVWVPVVPAVAAGLALLAVPQGIQGYFSEGFYFRGLIDQFYGIGAYLAAQLVGPAVVWSAIHLWWRYHPDRIRS